MRMSSDSKPPRPVYQPSDDFGARIIPVTRQPEQAWFRVHRSDRSPIQFGKFAHHRFTHPDCRFPMLHVGVTVPVCLWEYFGDDVFGGQRVISSGKWRGCSLSRIMIPALGVCDVCDGPTREAMGVDKASLLAADIAIPQAWGLALQEHPAAFDGIKYSSRFTDLPCLVLFDRGGMAVRMEVTSLGPLSQVNHAVDWLDERSVALV